MDEISEKKARDYKKNQLIVASQLYYWMKTKPDNMELKALALCISEMDEYVSSLSTDLAAAKSILITKNKENE